MSNGRWIAEELIAKTWAELDDDERQVFTDWLAHASAQDLYMLLRFVRRGRRMSSVQRMKASVGEDTND